MNATGTPDATVVIPNFNGMRFIGEAIESCITLQQMELEVIVVDDHSTDGSFEWLQQQSEKSPDAFSVYQTTEIERGACNARNIGLSHARSEHIKFLDADDYLLPGAIKSQLEQFKGLPQSTSVYGDVRWVEEDGSPCAEQYATTAGSTEAEQMILEAPLTSAPLHRTEDVRRVGGFDPRVPRGQEYDLHVRMWLAGVKFVYHPGLIYCYRQHGGPRISSSDGQDAVARGRLESLLRHVDLAREKFGTPLSDEMAVAFATNLWRNGRRALQTGASGVASDYFAAAKQLTGRRAVSGSDAYKLLTDWLGPRLAEKFSAFGNS